MLIGQGTTFVAADLFKRSDIDVEKGGLWEFLSILQVSFSLFFITFVLNIDKKYVSTFFSTTTAKQFRIHAFREATTDFMKFHILKLHESYYVSIRDEVQQWVRENWERWNEEQEGWFTDRVKASVPQDMIPRNEGDAIENKIGSRDEAVNKARRKSSLAAAKELVEELSRK